MFTRVIAAIALASLAAMPGIVRAQSSGIYSIRSDVSKGELDLRAGPGQTTDKDAADIRSVQRALAWLGIYPGPIDGAKGPATTQAIKHFQTTHQDLPTGSLTAAERSRLLNEARLIALYFEYKI